MKRNSPRHGQFYLEATGRRCFPRVNGSALTIWVWLSRWWLEVKKVKQEYQRCLGGSGWKLIIHCQPKKVSKLHVVFQHKPLQIWVQLFPWVFVVCVCSIFRTISKKHCFPEQFLAGTSLITIFQCMTLEGWTDAAWLLGMVFGAQAHDGNGMQSMVLVQVKMIHSYRGLVESSHRRPWGGLCKCLHIQVYIYDYLPITYVQYM